MGVINEHESDFNDLRSKAATENEKTISVEALKKILNQYQPQTWLRFIAKYSLGWFFDSFSYSQPVYQLKQLCNNKNDRDSLTEQQVKEALQQSSFFDMKKDERINKLERPNLFKNKSSKTDKLDTDGVIHNVLSEFNK